MEERRTNIDWVEIFVGIIFIIGAFMVLKRPEVSLLAISTMIGSLALIGGVSEIIIRNRISRLTGVPVGFSIFSGVIQILIGLYIIFNPAQSTAALPMVFAFWVIFTSIMGLIIIWNVRKIFNGAFAGLLALNIISLILGFLMIKNPIGAALTIVWMLALHLISRGIRYIIYAF